MICRAADVKDERNSRYRSCCSLRASPWPGRPRLAPTRAGPHTPEHQVASLGSFQFESGETIDDLKVSYVTYGKLNAARDNVVLSLQHFTWGPPRQ